MSVSFHLIEVSSFNPLPDEFLAFGDANNDLEMLALTQHSYAMEQSSPQVKRTATYQAPSNNNSGVLAIIETYLD